MDFEHYEEFFRDEYACCSCRDLGEMESAEIRYVKDYTFFFYSPDCLACCGTGIQPIPFGELRGLTYEAWKESATVSHAPPKRRKRRAR